MFIKADGLFVNLKRFDNFVFESQERDGAYCIEFDLYKKMEDGEPALSYLSHGKISTWEASERCIFCIEELFAEYLEKSKFCDIQELIETQIKLSQFCVKLDK